MAPRWERFYAVIRQIPAGRVTTYGEVARLAGFPRAAREVGWALRALPEGHDVPWWRVVNAAGTVTPRPCGAAEQVRRLRAEGIPIHEDYRLSLQEHGWEGDEEPLL
ncbi:MAG: Methylated-DNA-[protein]-cysteine S-methyltransferase binding protein [Armatimonadetes bacterium]|jgi:methylated-DNA-protein-cysteine methyltransferase-like protein|nr:Methylated-DNA-[protein]-cysteine S-methyltransferase binding protein [Armatimonadota bacterium]